MRRSAASGSAYVQPNVYRFDEYSYLNWEGVDFGGSWLWEAGNRWKGTLSYDQTKFLSGLADFRALIQNLRTVELARANAEYWLHPRGNSPTYRGALAGGGRMLAPGPV